MTPHNRDSLFLFIYLLHHALTQYMPSMLLRLPNILSLSFIGTVNCLYKETY